MANSQGTLMTCTWLGLTRCGSGDFRRFWSLGVQLLSWCGKWCSWRFNGKSHIWNLAWNLLWMLLDHLKMNEGLFWICFFFLPLNQASPKKRKSRWWFQRFFMFTPKFGEDEPNLTSLFFRCVGSTTTHSVKKKRHHAISVVTKQLNQLRWKPSRSWRTARGSEINSWRPSEDETAEEVIQGKSENARKKQRNKSDTKNPHDRCLTGKFLFQTYHV